MAVTALREPADVTRYDWRTLIGGELVETSSRERYETADPASGRLLATVPDAGAADVDAAVRAGHEASREWAAIGVRDRAAVIRKLAAIVRDHAGELGFLDALNAGHPVTAMTGDARNAASSMEMFADWALQLGGEVLPVSPDHLNYTLRQPYGVVAKIVPYNHPVMFAAGGIAGPLLAGNAVVLKPPPQAPLSALRLAELLRDELPSGLLSVIPGRDARAGELVVGHPGVRRIAFTGSVPAGQAVLTGAARAGIKNVTLELGGKNAMIVFPDSDVDAAADAAVRGMNFHWTAGQSCGSTSRLLLHESIADDVRDRVRERLAGIRIGDPLDEATEMGALISQAQWDKVMHYVEAGRTDGATLLSGGGRPSGERFSVGHWVAPTLFGDVRPDHRIAREEIFGPVLSVLTWSTPDEALRIANDVPYGLTASVWTGDVARAHRMAQQLDAGYVWINEVSRHFTGMPFGGIKDSGLGREECVEELRSYTESKSVHVSLAGGHGNA